MICQSAVLPLHAVDELKKALERMPESDFFTDRVYERRGLAKEQPDSHRFVNPHNTWFDVTFDKEGNVADEKITLPYAYAPNYKTIKKTVAIALKWMAAQLNWQGETRQMGMSIMQHHALHKGVPTQPIPWHRDASDHTLVLLLDDENQWEGGDFHFQDQVFQPKKGYGVLFTNEGTQHSLDSFTPKSEGIDRTILTIHEKI